MTVLEVSGKGKRKREGEISWREERTMVGGYDGGEAVA
jgi:hypothetical protein